MQKQSLGLDAACDMQSDVGKAGRVSNGPWLQSVAQCCQFYLADLGSSLQKCTTSSQPVYPWIVHIPVSRGPSLCISELIPSFSLQFWSAGTLHAYQHYRHYAVCHAVQEWHTTAPPAWRDGHVCTHDVIHVAVEGDAISSCYDSLSCICLIHCAIDSVMTRESVHWPTWI